MFKNITLRSERMKSLFRVTSRAWKGTYLLFALVLLWLVQRIHHRFQVPYLSVLARFVLAMLLSVAIVTMVPVAARRLWHLCRSLWWKCVHRPRIRHATKLIFPDPSRVTPTADMCEHPTFKDWLADVHYESRESRKRSARLPIKEKQLEEAKKARERVAASIQKVCFLNMQLAAELRSTPLPLRDGNQLHQWRTRMITATITHAMESGLSPRDLDIASWERQVTESGVKTMLVRLRERPMFGTHADWEPALAELLTLWILEEDNA